MSWVNSGNISYMPAVVSRNNIIHLGEDDIKIDKRYYSEESPRRWYFVIDTGTHYVFQVVSMAYESGWDSWDKNGEALKKYLSGEVEILLQRLMSDFDFNNTKFDWITYE